MPTSVKSLLVAARNTLVEKGWTQGAVARDCRNNSVRATDDTAVCFCAIGALKHNGSVRGSTYWEALHLLSITIAETGSLETPSVAGFNDNPRTSKEDVLALFDLTIESL